MGIDAHHVPLDRIFAGRQLVHRYRERPAVRADHWLAGGLVSTRRINYPKRREQFLYWRVVLDTDLGRWFAERCSCQWTFLFGERMSPSCYHCGTDQR